MANELAEQVCEANRELVRNGLVTLTWGNSSGIDRGKGIVAIKPSGIPYEELTPGNIVVVDLDGNIVGGDLNPSSDTPTHLILYRAFPEIGGITHTHSTYATMFAQACRPVPCLGTTHADLCHGEVPLTRSLTEQEVTEDYEVNTGNAIVETISAPLETPAVLVAHHGPFTWGKNALESATNGVALEEVARIAWGTLALPGPHPPIPQHLLDKHFLRKHGSDAYYGQRGS